jgi:predicted acylesterase/phospholipase RssA
MYFVNEFGEDGGLPEQNDIVARAKTSSLDSIGWGLVYPDLGRTLVPYKREWDRGRALEQSWVRSHLAREKRGGIRDALSKWRNDAIEYERPGVIFNATVADTGKPVTFNTIPTTKTPKGDQDPLELVSSYRGLFEEGEEETDVKVVTALRLSAAFPYVSPAARADPQKVGEEAPHIVDGGYYDNYGISSLVEWLDAELTRNNAIRNVLVVEICGGPSESGLRDEEAGTCSQQPVKEQDLGSKRRWIYQLLEPAQTVLNVRNPAQRARNDVELDLLQDRWEDNPDHSVTIERALFEFDCPNPCHGT